MTASPAAASGDTLLNALRTALERGEAAKALASIRAMPDPLRGRIEIIHRPVARWRAFEPWLWPLRDALGDAARDWQS